jgi:MAP/microtubule affinity-regulating kinase
MRKIQSRSRSFTPSLLPDIRKIGQSNQPVSQQREKFESGLSDYEIIRQLGKGSFGIVYLAKSKLDNTRVAIKSYEKTTPQLLKNVQNEVKVLKILEHPNIVKLLDVRQEPTSIHLILEYIAGSSLESFVKSRQLDSTECKKIFKQILSALNYCHSLGVAHRDLKPSNILIDSGKKIKIIDFGFASLKADSQLKFYCGTPEFMAPELMMQKAYYGQKVDVWALGVILFFLVSKKYPFVGRNERDLLKKVTMVGVQNNLKIPSEVFGLIRRMLTVDPNHRISTAEAIKDLWLGISKYQSYIKYERSLN